METITQTDRERIKRESRHLRGQLARELADMSAVRFTPESEQILAFHGVIAGYHRDTAEARQQAGLDREYGFSVRIACPGGSINRDQYLGLDALSMEFGDGTLRVSRGHCLMLHHVKKQSLPLLLRAIGQLGLSTLATAGDVLLPISHPAQLGQHPLQADIAADAALLESLRLPKTTAYRELWYGEPECDHGDVNPEPLYGRSYLPSPLTMAMTTGDLAGAALGADIVLVADAAGAELAGYHLLVGGHLADPPALAAALAYVPRPELMRTIEALVKLWRDHGPREGQERRRLSEVIRSEGTEWMCQTMQHYLMAPLQQPRSWQPNIVRPSYGWQLRPDGTSAVELPLLAGRITNHDGEALQTALGDVLSEHDLTLHLTPQNHLVLAGIREEERITVEYKLRRHGVAPVHEGRGLKSTLTGCAALPLCLDAKAESERVLPVILGELEQVMERCGLHGVSPRVSVSGCDKGCAAARLAEIGLVGVAPGLYDLYVGGSPAEHRINRLLARRLPLSDLAAVLEPLFASWSAERMADESFGDYDHRTRPLSADAA
ncbi:MAG: hypothetical protein SFW63_04000 [Alphaproteobacteria bacterium]|nr:hypothetical protein [Alphaproteobacteria bacterium]